ncbi:DUF3515 domain-containing protein [Nocardioides koreensis]|uniref:DUF3515 domain-containing protein n=1 Tax=Nocardioides koreensis TaxID=433651 RepID=UPI0031CEF84E
MSTRTRGVAASACALLLAGCGGPGPVGIDAPSMSDADAAACRNLVEDLPEQVAGEESRTVSGDTDLGAAWGDPAIVLTCGVPVPSGFDDTSTCIEAAGVGWYVPDEVLLSDDQSKDVTMTAVGYRPRVQVFLPGSYRPDGFPNTAATIGAVVDRDLRLVERCK